MSRGVHAVAAAIATLCAALVLSSPAAAEPVVNGEFPLPAGETVGSNNEIVQGPDGNMWVTTDTNSVVVRYTPDGTATPFAVPNTPVGITVGPDDNLWISSTVGVMRMDPVNPAAVDAFNGIGLEDGHGITAGPDGNMWVVGTANAGLDGELIRFSPADPDGTATATLLPGANPKGMDVGSDGTLWIADQKGAVWSATASDTPNPTPQDIQLGGAGGAQDVAAGPDAQVAYVAPTTDPQSVGRIATGGTPEPTELEASDPFGVAFGQDGAYWIARAGTNDLLRLTPGGSTSTLSGFPPAAAGLGPRKIATGPNNTLWVTLDEREAVARVTGVEPGGGGGGLDTTITKKPKRKLKLRGKKRRATVRFRFRASNPAANFECKLKRKKAKRKPRFRACTSPRTYKLKPGKYTFQVRATAGGVVDPSPAKAKFKIVRRK